MNLQNFPENLHRALKRVAANRDTTLNKLIVSLVRCDKDVLKTEKEVIAKYKKI